MTKPEKLIQSYVSEKFFVSTAYRQCSAVIESPPWYYETIVFDWDKQTRKIGSIIDTQDSGSNPYWAIKSHNKICEKIISEQYGDNSTQQRKGKIKTSPIARYVGCNVNYL